MIAGEFFAEAKSLPFASIESITVGGGLVVVAPHPDDESLGCGGLIAAARAKGISVRLVVVSDGTGSHAGSRRYPKNRLRSLREAETEAAVGELGLDPDGISFLRLPDRFVPTHGPRADMARSAIVAAAKEASAGAVCVTWHHDPHCDHVAAAALVSGCTSMFNGTRVLSYPVWGWTLADDVDVGEAPRGLRFNIKPYLPMKSAAIAAHRSQTTNLIDDDPKGFRLTKSMLANFAKPYEILLDTHSASAR